MSPYQLPLSFNKTLFYHVVYILSNTLLPPELLAELLKRGIDVNSIPAPDEEIRGLRVFSLPSRPGGCEVSAEEVRSWGYEEEE
jgi:hypothetical protein